MPPLREMPHHPVFVASVDAHCFFFFFWSAQVAHLQSSLAVGERAYQVSDELGRVRSQCRAGEGHAEGETACGLACGHGPRIKYDARSRVSVDHGGARLGPAWFQHWAKLAVSPVVQGQ